MTSREPTINELIERSSLGSAGAKRLRARTTDEQIELVRRLANHSSARVTDLDVVAILLQARAALEQLEYEALAIAQARAELDQQRTEAAARAGQLVADAQAEATRLVAEARARAAEIEATVRSTATSDTSWRSGGTLLVAGGPSDSPPDQDPSLISDTELMRRHVAGDADAFGQLVKRHRDRMFAVAIRTLGDSEEAGDALQEAFITAFRRADSFRGDAKVTTWLHRIVVNACLDRIRRRQTRAADPLPEEEDRAAELAGPIEDDAAEIRLDVLHAMEQLSPDQRNALVLVDMEGYSIEEAAVILGSTPATVKSRCARGRARLLPLLRRAQTTRTATETTESGRPG